MKSPVFLVAFFLLVLQFPDKLVAMVEAPELSDHENNLEDPKGSNRSVCSNNTNRERERAIHEQYRKGETASSSLKIKDTDSEGDLRIDSQITTVDGWSPSCDSGTTVPDGEIPEIATQSTQTKTTRDIGIQTTLIDELIESEPSREVGVPIRKAYIQSLLEKQNKSPNEERLINEINKANDFISKWLKQLKIIEQELPFSKVTTDWITPLKLFIERQQMLEQSSSSIEELLFYCWESQQDYASYLDSYNEGINQLIAKNSVRNLQGPERSYRESTIQTLQAQQYRQLTYLYKIILNREVVIKLAQRIVREQKKLEEPSVDRTPSYDFTARLKPKGRQEKPIVSNAKKANAVRETMNRLVKASSVTPIPSANVRSTLTSDNLQDLETLLYQEAIAINKKLMRIGLYQGRCNEAINVAKANKQRYKELLTELQLRLSLTNPDIRRIEKELFLVERRLFLHRMDGNEYRRYYNFLKLQISRNPFSRTGYQPYYLFEKLEPFQIEQHRIAEFIIASRDQRPSEIKMSDWSDKTKELIESYTSSRSNADTLYRTSNADTLYRKWSDFLSSKAHSYEQGAISLKDETDWIRKSYKRGMNSAKKAAADCQEKLEALLKQFQNEDDLLRPDTWIFSINKDNDEENNDEEIPFHYYSRFGCDLAWKKFINKFGKIEESECIHLYQKHMQLVRASSQQWSMEWLKGKRDYVHKYIAPELRQYFHSKMNLDSYPWLRSETLEELKNEQPANRESELMEREDIAAKKLEEKKKEVTFSFATPPPSTSSARAAAAATAMVQDKSSSDESRSSSDGSRSSSDESRSSSDGSRSSSDGSRSSSDGSRSSSDGSRSSSDESRSSSDESRSSSDESRSSSDEDEAPFSRDYEDELLSPRGSAKKPQDMSHFFSLFYWWKDA